MRWFFIVVFVLLLGSAITWRMQQKHAQTAKQAQMQQMRTKAPASVELAQVQTHDIVNSFEATGSVEAPLNVKISPKITGLIDYLKVREGDTVSRGQLLVGLDPAEIQANVNQAKAAQAQAEYRLAQAKLTQNPNDVQVMTQLRQQNAGVASSQANYNQVVQNYKAQLAAANDAVNDARSKVKSAQASVANADANVDSANTNLDSGKAGIENAQATITSAKANLENAQNKLKRTTELYKQGYAAAQDVDDAKATVAVQQGAVDVAQGQLKMALSALGVQKSAVEVAKGQLKVANAALDSAVEQQKAAEEQANIVKTTGQANIEASHASLQQSKASLDYAKSNKAQTPAYVQNIAALRAAVDAAKASVALTKTQLTQTKLNSPLDGYVTARYMDPGGMASPGQPILEVQSIARVWVTIAVPEETFTKLQIGQSATVRFDSFSNRTYTARIVQMNPAADPQGRQFTVRVMLDNAKENFKPGMFARVSLVTERVPGAIVVPREAVQQDKSGSSYLMSVDEQNIAHKLLIETGSSDASFIQIRSTAQVGDKVVVMSASPVKDGAMVRAGKGRGQRGGKPGVPGNENLGPQGGAPGQQASEGSGAAQSAQNSMTPTSGQHTHTHSHGGNGAGQSPHSEKPLGGQQ